MVVLAGILYILLVASSWLTLAWVFVATGCFYHMVIRGYWPASQTDLRRLFGLLSWLTLISVLATVAVAILTYLLA